VGGIVCTVVGGTVGTDGTGCAAGAGPALGASVVLGTCVVFGGSVVLGAVTVPVAELAARCAADAAWPMKNAYNTPISAKPAPPSQRVVKEMRLMPASRSRGRKGATLVPNAKKPECLG